MIGAQGQKDKVKVFISYSRKDLAFVKRIVAALAARGLLPKLDVQDLPTLEDWKRELLVFIRESDAVVFIVSPNSISSPVCAWEVEQVTTLNKRLAPIVLERVSADGIPEGIARINYLFFDPPNDFERQADILAAALQTDLTWVKEHTRLGELARRWNDRKRSAALLLQGLEIEDAERWIASRPRTAQEPTEAHKQLIAQSRKAAGRRQRYAVVGSLAAAAMAMGLAGTAYWQRGIAVENGEHARNERNQVLLNQSQLLATVAKQNLDKGDAASAMLYAIEALNDQDSALAIQRDRPYEPIAEAVLYASHFALRERRVLPGPARNENYYYGPTARFSPTKRYVLMRDPGIGKAAQIFDLQRNTVVFDSADVEDVVFAKDEILIIASGNSVAVYNLASGDRRDLFKAGAFLSPDGSKFVTSDSPGRVLDTKSGALISILESHAWESSNFNGAAFSSDGGRFVYNCAVWDTSSGKRIWAPAQGSENHDTCRTVLSPDGRWLAVAHMESEAEIWNLNSAAIVGRPKFKFDFPVFMSFSPNNKYFAAFSPASDFRRNSDDLIALWPLDKNDTFSEFPLFLNGHSNTISSVYFGSKDDALISASADNTARIWRIAEAGDRVWGSTGPLAATFAGHAGPVTSAEFSPEESEIVTASSDGTVRIWRAEPRRKLDKSSEQELTGGFKISVVSNRTAVDQVFDRSRTKALSLSEDKAILRDFGSGRVLHVFEARYKINDAALSPDGRFVVVGTGVAHGGDGEGALEGTEARLWDTNTGQLLAILPHDAAVDLVGFTQDGRQLVTRSTDVMGKSEIWGWQVFPRTQDLIDHSKVVTPRCLTVEQRRNWSLNPEPPAWCIDTGKWPYSTEEWKQWLANKRAGKNPQLPP